MKELIVKLLQKALKEKKIKLKEEEIEKLLEIPPSVEMGDYAFPCFSFAEKLRREPNQAALEIREKIRDIPVNDLDDIQTSNLILIFL